MKQCSITILGASGLVGRELIKLLERENFPVKSLKLLGGNKSDGKYIPFKGEDIRVEKADKDSFLDSDIIFGCAKSSVTKEFLPYIKGSGAYFIDNSSLLRLEDNVPLIVPEINSSILKKEDKLIANPNCSTIIVLLAVYPLFELYGISSLEVTSFQAVSGAGQEALDQLKKEIMYIPSKENPALSVFPETIFGNAIPMIGKIDESGFTDEERKMQNEGRKILKDSQIKINCTCVRVPVERCHSFSVTAILKKDFSVDRVKEELGNAPYLRKYCEPYFPSPLKSEGSFKVSIGRIRKNLAFERGISLFCSSDQLIRGACGNALKTGEFIVSNFL